MPQSCSVVRSSTSTSLFTTGPMPTTATWLSVSLAASAASSFSSAKMSERPIWALPSLTSDRPWPEPPPAMVMVTLALASMKAFAASSTSGWKLVAPEQVMEPDRSAAALEAASAVLAEPEPPQPTRPRPAKAARPPDRPRN